MKNTGQKHSSKILLAVILATIFSATNVNAQDKAKGSSDAPFIKGSKTIGLSLGFGVDYGYNTAYYGGSYVNAPAYALTYDQGFWENVGPGTIGIGGLIGYKSARYKYSYNNVDYKDTYSNFIIGVRGTYHLTLLKDKNNKFDPYGGITTGVRIYNYTDNYDFDGSASSSSVNPIIGVFVGAKYNFTKNFGAFSELGYDISFFRIGINGNF